MRRIQCQPQRTLRYDVRADIAVGTHRGREIIERAMHLGLEPKRAAQRRQRRLQVGQAQAGLQVERVGEIGAGGIQMQGATVHGEGRRCARRGRQARR